MASSPANLLYRDIHAPTDLLPKLGAAIADLSPSRRDVILLTANYQQYDLAVNLIAELAAHGLHNYLLLCDNEALVDHAKNLGAVAAAWSSMLDRFARSPDPTCSCFGAMPDGWTSMPPGTQRTYGAGTYCNRSLRNRPGSCTPSVSAFYRCHSVRRLWLMRFHYAARLIAMGHHVLLLDSDSLVLANPYPLIEQHLDRVSAIGMEDISAWPQMTLNGGTWYFRARPDGPVVQWLRAFMRRVMRVLTDYPAIKHYDVGKPLRADGKTRKTADFLLFDQTVLNAALIEALVGHPVALNSSLQVNMISHRDVDDFKRVGYLLSCCHVSPPTLGHPPWSRTTNGHSDATTAAPPVTTTSSNRQLRKFVRDPYGWATLLRTVELRNGHGGAAETLIKAPPWLFSGESDLSSSNGRTASTFWGMTPPPASIVHFVCTSWPGSDGRRTAMRLWGHWHAREILEQMDGGSGATTRTQPQQLPQRPRYLGPPLGERLAVSRRAFVSFDAPVDARNPQALEPYLRLITLVAHATRRTPVLPLMRCDLDDQWWVDDRIDPNTGVLNQRLMDERTAIRKSGRKPPKGVERPCGWAVHSIGGEMLPHALCVQRPMEGCFHAFATADELAAHLPSGFWRGFAEGGASRNGESSSSQPLVGGHPTIELPKRMANAPTIAGRLRDALGRRAYEPLTIDAALSLGNPELARHILPEVKMNWGGAGGPIPNNIAPLSSAILFLKAPPASALAAKEQALVNELATFDKAIAQLKAGWHETRLSSAWNRCLKMVRKSKCTSVC